LRPYGRARRVLPKTGMTRPQRVRRFLRPSRGTVVGEGVGSWLSLKVDL
jgi:hypothetical protein